MFRPLNAPLCPKCGSEESKVMGRYTSQDNDCVRERRCLECDRNRLKRSFIRQCRCDFSDGIRLAAGSGV
jgi:hypothetical protein